MNVPIVGAFIFLFFEGILKSRLEDIYVGDLIEMKI